MSRPQLAPLHLRVSPRLVELLAASDHHVGLALALADLARLRHRMLTELGAET